MGLETALHDVRITVVFSVSLKRAGESTRSVWGAGQSASASVKMRYSLRRACRRTAGRIAAGELKDEGESESE
jgi:hypothetical protein